MPFEEEVGGLRESHAPDAVSDLIRLDLARESVRKLTDKTNQLSADIAQLERDLAASQISLADYERTKGDLEKAIASGRKALAIYEMHERRLTKIFATT